MRLQQGLVEAMHHTKLMPMLGTLIGSGSRFPAMAQSSSRITRDQNPQALQDTPKASSMYE